MDIKDKKIIEELLTKQVENLGQVIDTRLQEQTENLNKVMGVRFQEQSKHFGQVIDTRFQEQSMILESKMINVFNEGFEQIVLPHIVRHDDKIDGLEKRFDGLEKKVDDIGYSQDRMERKLNAVVDRQDKQGIEIKKIKKFVKMPETV